MMVVPAAVRIYLAAERHDMRKSIDGLAAVVRGAWGKDVFSGHLFVFLGRRSDRVKVLAWDRGGFVLYYKRLERGRFHLPPLPQGASVVELDGPQLSMLLDGIDLGDVDRPALWAPPAGVAVST